MLRPETKGQVESDQERRKRIWQWKQHAKACFFDEHLVVWPESEVNRQAKEVSKSEVQRSLSAMLA